MVWGDDFTFLGREKDLLKVLEKMRKLYSIQMTGKMGLDPEDEKKLRILNRVVRWTEARIEYEADDKHATTIVKELGLQEDSKDNTLTKEHGAEEGDQELNPKEAAKYRSLAATFHFLALGRPDIQFAAGALGRTMARPTTKGWANLKKSGRHLLDHPRMVFK